MVTISFFLPFDFYSTLFGDLGFVCFRFGLCLQALRILGLHGYWFRLQICVIWLIYYWILLFDFLCLGFSWCFNGCFGTVLRIGETWKQLGQVKIRHDLSWLRTRTFGLKRKKWAERGGMRPLEGRDIPLCVFFCECLRVGIFFSFNLKAFEGHYYYWDCTSKVI